MDIDLELYRGKEPQYFGSYEFPSVLRQAAQRQFGKLARRGQIELVLDGPEAGEVYAGPPEVRNLAARIGHCLVRVIEDGETVHERRLRIVDLIGPVLADELKALHPDEDHWGFRLRRQRSSTLVILGSKIAQQLIGEERPVPEIQGSVDVDPGGRRHQPFTLTPMARAEEELVRPEDFGLDPDRLGKINILMSAEIHDQFLHTMPLASRMEEGGFLLGRVTKAGDEVHLVEVTHVTPAHRSGAGLVHFTFTGESFLSVAQLIEERGESEELVGWYHTHLFGVNVGMGLSSIDVDLHLATFQRPWQVAALINIRNRGRLLRFYGRDDKTLREYEQWICDDGGKYSPASAALGGE